jgi:hypothetical protein
VSRLVALAGWAAAAALFGSLRRRLSLVADAEHELRGAAAAIGLAAERSPRQGGAALVRLQLDRMGAALSDLAAARAWRAPDGDARVLDAGRLAQVLGNLVANAAEHGEGPVKVATSRPEGGIRIEIRNRNRPPELDAAARRARRGRGLAIAARAARELGAELTVESHDGQTTAELELPAGAIGATHDGQTRAGPGGSASPPSAGASPTA